MSEKKPIDKQLLIWKFASIAITVLFVPIIFFNSFLIISTVAAKDKVPMMFGYGTVFVMSDSMKGEFETNDAILIKKVDDINSLQIGDIICYREDGGFVTHRIDGMGCGGF